MTVAFLPPLLPTLLGGMASFLQARSAWRLAVLSLGRLFAQGQRRPITSWLRAASAQVDFPAFYYFLGSLGRHAARPAAYLLQRLLQELPAETSIRFAIDDSPTQRYGPKVQGAGVHHNPSPGPADAPFLYGHLWVTLALVVCHPRWGVLALPLRSLLYIRHKDLPKVPAWCRPPFRTKLELAAELIGWAVGLTQFTGRSLLALVDGAYAKKPFRRAAQQAGVTVISRLRRDAGLRHLPRPRPPGQRGRPAVYGSRAIRLALRAAQTRGWQTVRVRQYGRDQDQTIKTFEVTWRPVGGRLRVVLVQEEDDWLAWFSTDPEMAAAEILRGAADRMTIEQDFHDLKEVEGWGQPQLRNLHANLGATQLTLWEFSLVELWAWDQPEENLVDRTASPWDDPRRRPSHADKRKALQRWCLQQEFRQVCHGRPLDQEIEQFIVRLLDRAA